MAPRHLMARVEGVHELARAMPHVTVAAGPSENPVYQVGGKSFVFFRNPRPDAFDPHTGDRYPDVIVFWVADEAEKQSLGLARVGDLRVRRADTAVFTTRCSQRSRR